MIHKQLSHLLSFISILLFMILIHCLPVFELFAQDQQGSVLNRDTETTAVNSRGDVTQFKGSFLEPAEETTDPIDCTMIMIEPGFPVQCYATSGSYHGGAAIHTCVDNIDTDPELEIVVSALGSGPLYAWNYDGSEVTGFPVGPGGVGYMGMGNLAGAGGMMEIFSGHWGTPGQLTAYDGYGSTLAGWPQNSANYVTTPPALSDIEDDGIDEMFIGEEDGRVHGYAADGTVLPGWPAYNPVGGQERHTPAAIDLDGDGDLEILSVTGSISSGVYLLAYHHDGSDVAGYPVQFPSGYTDTYIAIGDVDGDSMLEIVLVLREDASPWRALITVVSTDGTTEASWLSTGSVPYGTAPALGDLDGDSILDIVVQTGNTLDAYNGDGTTIPGFPVTISGRWLGNSSPVVGDADGDGEPDILITTQVEGSSFYGDVRLYDKSGNIHPDFPIDLNIGAGAVPALADFDLDGRTEIIITGSYWDGISGYNDKVWAFDMEGSNYGPVFWPQFGGNSHHTGLYSEDTTGVYSDPAEPNDFIEMSTHPNPTRNRFLSISTTLPEGVTGTVLVYDIHGRVISTFLAESVISAVLETTGVYFIRLVTSSGETLTQRCAVIR